MDDAPNIPHHDVNEPSQVCEVNVLYRVLVVTSEYLLLPVKRSMTFLPWLMNGKKLYQIHVMLFALYIGEMIRK